MAVHVQFLLLAPLCVALGDDVEVRGFMAHSLEEMSFQLLMCTRACPCSNCKGIKWSSPMVFPSFRIMLPCCSRSRALRRMHCPVNWGNVEQNKYLHRACTAYSTSACAWPGPPQKGQAAELCNGSRVLGNWSPHVSKPCSSVHKIRLSVGAQRCQKYSTSICSPPAKQMVTDP